MSLLLRLSRQGLSTLHGHISVPRDASADVGELFCHRTEYVLRKCHNMLGSICRVFGRVCNKTAVSLCRQGGPHLRLRRRPRQVQDAQQGAQQVEGARLPQEHVQQGGGQVYLMRRMGW